MWCLSWYRLPRCPQITSSIGEFQGQNVANTVWAYATLDASPGAAVLDLLANRALASCRVRARRAQCRPKTVVTFFTGRPWCLPPEAQCCCRSWESLASWAEARCCVR